MVRYRLKPSSLSPSLKFGKVASYPSASLSLHVEIAFRQYPSKAPVLPLSSWKKVLALASSFNSEEDESNSVVMAAGVATAENPGDGLGDEQ